MAGTDAESGRGVALMHALMDQVRFTSEPEKGTIVHLVKRLEFDDDSPTRQLMLAAFADDEDDASHQRRNQA
jgi:serine/threonine-protein kinase RsbW